MLYEFLEKVFIAIICYMFLLPMSLIGQKKYTISFLNDDYKQVNKNVSTHFKSEYELKKKIEDIQYLAYKKGYLLASFDDVITTDSFHYDVNFVVGKRFRSIILDVDSQELAFIKKKTSLSEKILSKVPLSPNDFARFMHSLHRIYLNEGYPFSKIYLDSIIFFEASITAMLRVERGIQLMWSSLFIRGDTIFSEKMLSNLIKIKPNQRYSELSFEQISEKIQQIHFIEEIQPAKLLFTHQGVELYTYLKRKSANSLYGMVGFQPNTQTSRISLTGEVSLKLQNLLKRVEKISIEWNGVGEKTQDLKAQLHYPYLFNTSFGVGTVFELHKNDSTFLDVKTMLSVDYYFSFHQFISAFYQTNSSNLLSGAFNSNMSNLGAIRTNYYGLLFSNIKVDNPRNPRSGWTMLLNCSVGVRNTSVLDSVASEKNTVFRSELHLSNFFSLSSRVVLLLRNQTMLYYAPTIYSNETYRYGGAKVQRGFNEQELHSTAQTTFSAEGRFLMDKNSFVFLFFDQSLYENNSETYYRDDPYGFGAGLSFGTNAGFFSLTYALGQQFNNPLFLRDGKIHFGYISYF